jgi:hypothetical protein
MVTDENGIHGLCSGLSWDDAKAWEPQKKQAVFDARIICSGHSPVVMDAEESFWLRL